MYQIYGTIVAPPAGLEPATSWLTVMRSANWAIEEYIYFSLYTKDNSLSYYLWHIFCSGNFLLSQAVAHQVSSTLRSLTSVFGMGTGGSSLLSSPDKWGYTLKTKQHNLLWFICGLSISLYVFFPWTSFLLCICKQMLWSSLRAISTGQLHTLLHFHLRPINQVVFLGPYLWGNLILKGASRLDAFSVYPVRT